MTLELPAGDYLVIAVLDDGRFHEVYRRVPKNEETLGGIYPHRRWSLEADGSIHLAHIAIPDMDVTRNMALIAELSDGKEFYMDCHEFTVEDYRRP